VRDAGAILIKRAAAGQNPLNQPDGPAAWRPAAGPTPTYRAPCYGSSHDIDKDGKVTDSEVIRIVQRRFRRSDAIRWSALLRDISTASRRTVPTRSRAIPAASIR